MNKRLILLRHAHRDMTDRRTDNGLSEKGRKQVQSLVNFFENRMDDDGSFKEAQFFSSPKKRCLETLGPLAEKARRSIVIRQELTEQHDDESIQSLDQRIHQFFHSWTQEGASTTFMCSHGDILPLAAFHLLGVSFDIRKGSWLELEWSGGRAHLQWFVRNFKFF
jgi:broad specificity phosphatase PhoE